MHLQIDYVLFLYVHTKAEFFSIDLKKIQLKHSWQKQKWKVELLQACLYGFVS